MLMLNPTIAESVCKPAALDFEHWRTEEQKVDYILSK